jgi:general secretion pathway protein H
MSREGARRRGQAGFTLIEIVVVLVILGLVLGVVVSRGPMRSRTLELRGVASQVAETLRLARSRAIAANHPVRVIVDVDRRSYRIDTLPAQTLPPGVSVAVVAIGEETAGKRLGAIRFDPDGSASGGRIELTQAAQAAPGAAAPASGARKVQVGVDWLTGRVSVADAH